MRSWARLLPLTLLAAMLAIGVALEAVLYGGPDLPPKLPLAALLALAFIRGRRRPAAGDDAATPR